MPFNKKTGDVIQIRRRVKPTTHTPEQERNFKDFIVLGYTFEQASLAVMLPLYYTRKALKQAAIQAQNELKLYVLQNLKQHVRDNASAAVFAAKAKLGWQDQVKQAEQQAVEYIDLPSTETREQWQKRHAKTG